MKTNLLKKLKKNEIYSLYDILYKKDDETIDIWVNRSEPLLKLILEIKEHLNIEEEKINEILNFDYLIKFYGDQLKNKTLQSELNSYFLCLPGFSLYAEKQGETTYEMHGFLQMQLVRFFSDLDILLADDIIYKKDYFTDNEKKETFIQEIITYFPDCENFNEMINYFLKMNVDINHYNLITDLISKKSEVMKNYMINILGYTNNPLVNKHNDFLVTFKNKIDIIDFSRKLKKDLINNKKDEKLIKI